MAVRTRGLTLWTHKKYTGCTEEQKGEGGGSKSAPRSRKPRREVAEPGPKRRDRERSGLAGDGAGAGGRSLGRRRAEGGPKACCRDQRSEPQRNMAARRRAESVGPDHRTIAPGVGAERTQDLTLWTHKKFTGLTEEQKGDGGDPKSAP
ncbi:hypothetical protein NDU88_001155 [Pleurodeles waltl]|uniref:Uncharacterized protein n=1 Tax=Pleurodeles waltl TaxID=8319 RepID=A0AAV7L8P1_PLEWA|nr:hypothetical protein NDU88_001155 [Pleurodeles waltl]